MTKLEKDNSEATDEIGRDIVIVMLKILQDKDINNKATNEQLVKLAVRSLVTLQKYFPDITLELKGVSLDLHERLKE